ncbi:hypothetical protein [Aurantiacibacter gilvus]|uniref:CTP synthetase n=1 Tax=Aurantiacibacter gilvus TaxID=3139141 RepID=A0ABU9ICM0_9SPHN
MSMLRFLERATLLLLGAFGAVSGLRLMETPNLESAMVIILTSMGIALVAYVVTLRVVRPHRENAAEVNNGRP